MLPIGFVKTNCRLLQKVSIQYIALSMQTSPQQVQPFAGKSAKRADYLNTLYYILYTC